MHKTRIQKVVQYGCRIEFNKFTQKNSEQVFVVEKSYFSQTESSEIYLENRIVSIDPLQYEGEHSFKRVFRRIS